MGPLLGGLKQLQIIENRLRAVKGKLTRCRRNVIIKENQIRTLQNTLEAKHEEVQLTRVQSDRLELELKAEDEQINKLRASLNTARTNKEYAAILTQLNTTKADNSKVEAQTFELLKNIEDDETEMQKIKEQIEQQKQQLEKTRRQSETKTSEYQQEIESIQAEWDNQARQIPAETLEIFKKVAETYDGESLATVEQQGKMGGYTCGGCFMSITAESVNLLLTKDEIIRCPNCTRILILDEEQKD